MPNDNILDELARKLMRELSTVKLRTTFGMNSFVVNRFDSSIKMCGKLLSETNNSSKGSTLKWHMFVKTELIHAQPQWYISPNSSIDEQGYSIYL